MAQLPIVFAVIALAVTGAEVNTAVENAKVAILKKELPTTIDAIRKIKIDTPESKVQLASITTDYKTAIDRAVYTLNNVIPNVADDKTHTTLARLVELLSNYANDIEKAIPGDSEALKAKLIVQLENIKDEVAKCEADCKASNEFVKNQLNRKYDIYILALYKLKLQATLFAKTNKKLEATLGITSSEFGESLKRLNAIDKTVEIELRHALLHLSNIIARSVNRLENWVEVNPEKAEEIKRVQEVSAILSGLYEKLNPIVTKLPPLLLRDELVKIYKDAVLQVKLLTHLEYPEHSGQIEFIRSTIFDIITFGIVYFENTKAAVSSA